MMWIKYCLLITLISFVHLTGALIDLGELNCTVTLKECPPNYTCKGHCRDPCVSNEKTVWGTGFYPYISPICKSAAHDFRISVWNASDRTVLLQRTDEKAVFHGSIHGGISSSSYSFSPANLSSYQFLSPFISETLLDTASVHRGYLYGEDGIHVQECYVASKNSHINFNTYSGKVNNGQVILNNTESGNLTSIMILWTKPDNRFKMLNAGFLCIPEKNTLSIVTSVAFRKDAHFFPLNLTITASINETVTLTMFEKEAHNYETIWRKDGRKLKYIEPQSMNHTSLTLANIETGYSGIYSLEYKGFDVVKRGYVRLLVRACPDGKFGSQCAKSCRKCLNGGICHEITGDCICAPGFSGIVCEKNCSAGYFGKNCSLTCSHNLELDENACHGVLICLPDPYGCSCGAGFSGIFCEEKCLPGTFGAGCTQHRNCHCENNENCNPYSGVCNGKCAYGWHGDYCEELLIFVRNLSVESISPSAFKLRWNHTAEPSQSFDYVSVTYKQTGWRYPCDFPVHKNIFQDNTTRSFIILEKLEPFAIYAVNVSVVRSIAGPPAQVTVETAATVPSSPRNFQLLFKTTSALYLSWQAPISPYGLLAHYEISYRNIDDDFFTKALVTVSEMNCNKQNNLTCYAIKHLKVEQEYDIQLRAFNLNVGKGSEPVRLLAETSLLEPETILISILKQEQSEVVIHISLDKSKVDAERKYFIVVNAEDIVLLDEFEYAYHDPNCSHITANGPQSYIVAMLNGIPNEGLNFTIGDNSCLHGYLNPPLNDEKSYRFGVVSILTECEDVLYGSIIYSNLALNSPLPSSRALIVTLVFLIPLVVIAGIIALIIILRRTKSLNSFSWKMKFISSKAAIENEFAACNEALDELDIDTESICEDLSNCISVDELNEFVKLNAKSLKLKREFLSAPRGQLYFCFAAKEPDNKSKNRYGNILTFDHSRVILGPLEDSTYIHANYIQGYIREKEFIATQGPMPHTVNDFWRMVWQEKAIKIIMITNVMEHGKSKCEKYWTDESSSYGDIELLFVLSESFADFVVRTFQLSKADETREVKQFHFTSFPDHRVPSNTTPFLNFLEKVRKYNPNSNTPVIIHCSAGIGRTGAVILFENVFSMGNKESKVDVLRQLFNMRKQRMNIVENYEQYLFVYYALVEALCVGKTSLHYKNYLTEYPQLQKSLDETGLSTIDKEFKMLNDLPVQILQKDIVTAYMISNQSKNRSMHILPSERARHILRKRSNDSDYINAVYIDGYKIKNWLVATQHPLPETLADFWKMVYELNCRIVVVLQEIQFSKENPELCTPQGTQKFGDLYVTCETISEMKDVITMDFKVKESMEIDSSLSLKVLKIKTWCTESDLPSDTSPLLSIVDLLELWEDFDSCITVTCLDGVSACGVFCALLNIIDRIKCVKEVDIFKGVKCVRTNRPQFIINLEQYRLLHELTNAYLQKLDS